MIYFLAIALLPHVAYGLALQKKDVALSAMDCKKTHPGVFLESGEPWTAAEILDCYSTWHEQTLASWRSQPGKSCEGRRARVVTVNRGLGDAGFNILGRFRQALRSSEMLLLNFDLGPDNVWKQAMDAPFHWDVRENLDLFCFSSETEYMQWRSAQGEQFESDEHIQCPTCADPGPGPDKDFVIPTDTELLNYLYKPSSEVKLVVDKVMSEVHSHERLFGVHFRSEWTGVHFGCGCKEPSAIGRCASNLVPFLASRGFGNASDSRPVKLFVASDQLNGIGAFQRAFGSSSILALPDDLQIEHSLEASHDGSIRIMSDFITLTKAEGMIGTCGSTFSNLAHLYSGRSGEAYVDTGDPGTIDVCVAGAQPLDFSGFAFESFAYTSEAETCGCYKKGDTREGVCAVACDSADQHPTGCASWTQTQPNQDLIAKHAAQPFYWRTPMPRTIFPTK